MVGLLRDGPLAPRRAGRSRGAALGITWLDTAGGALAEAGLALEEPRRGPRRLLRILPEPGAVWIPGSPPDPLGTFGTDDAPEAAGGAPLLPVATLVGTCTRTALHGAVEAAMVRGTITGGGVEAPVARLTLTGPAEAVIETMEALAAAAHATPPRAALAEIGLALAAGRAPRPRRLGAPVLDPSLDVEAALVLALGHLTEVLLWHAPTAIAGTKTEGVHQMRVAMRRMRSLLRVFRPACDGEALRGFDAALKGLAGGLGPARDWDVWLGGLGAEVAAALPGEKRIARLVEAGQQRREAAYAALRPMLEGRALREVAWGAVSLARLRPWRAEADEDAAARRATPLSDFAEGVLGKRWRRIEAAGTEIGDLPDEEFHQLRIEAKRMRYAAELFAPLWGRKRGKRFLNRLAEVQEAFGLANDAVVAHALMASLGTKDDPGTAWATGVAEGWALARARRARTKATDAWEDLLAGERFWDAD